MDRGPIRVVGGVCVQAGAVLAFRRAAHKSQAGFWEFPGGKVEPGESAERALRRELLEELGVESQIGVLLHRATTTVGTLEIDLSCYLVTFTPLPSASSDHDLIEWQEIARLESALWAPADRPAVTLLRGQVNEFV